MREGLNDHQRKHRKQDDHDRQHADERKQTYAPPDFFLHHLTERFPATPDRGEENNHIVHAAAERCTNQDPESAGQKPKLRRQHRTDQWPGSGNCRKVMAENHPAIRWHIIFTVILQDCRCGALLIKHEHLCCQPFAVEAIANGQRAKSSQNNPERADLFAAGERKDCHRPYAQRGDANPEQLFPPTHVICSLVEIVALRHKLWSIVRCEFAIESKNFPINLRNLWMAELWPAPEGTRSGFFR